MHQGSTAGAHPVDFNTFAGTLFQEQVTPKFIEFLKKVYRKPTYNILSCLAIYLMTI
jgi:hypothetical protein